MKQKVIISHIKPIGNNVEDWQIQSNESHQKGVAEFAKQFADEFRLGEYGYVLGILHDKGKEKEDFQNYIRKISGYDINAKNYNNKNHAYVGALLAKMHYENISNFITNEIAGHHTGLYDYYNLQSLLNTEIPHEVNTNINKEKLPVDILQQFNERTYYHHLIRMLYSCLVDADFLDTERFMNYDSFMMRTNKTLLKDLKIKLDATISNFKFCEKTFVNKVRRFVQNRCLKTSVNPPGFYSLTVPTGGGKTISSVIWAINHAIEHNKKRIIIAIPYTSIITQTAEVLKSIFGDENVLEHHSDIDYENISSTDKHKIRNSAVLFPISIFFAII